MPVTGRTAAMLTQRACVYRLVYDTKFSFRTPYAYMGLHENIGRSYMSPQRLNFFNELRFLPLQLVFAFSKTSSLAEHQLQYIHDDR